MFDVALLSPGGQISGFCTYLQAPLLLYKCSDPLGSGSGSYPGVSPLSSFGGADGRGAHGEFLTAAALAWGGGTPAALTGSGSRCGSPVWGWPSSCSPSPWTRL